MGEARLTGGRGGFCLALLAAARWAGNDVLGKRVGSGGKGLDDRTVGFTVAGVLVSGLALGTEAVWGAPRLMALEGESDATRAMYGIGEPKTDDFGRACLMARRFATQEPLSPGAVVLVLLSALFGVGYAGFGILVALRTRNVQATNTSFLLFFPLLFLTPNFVPFARLTPVMETLARLNPVSYVIDGLRSLVIEGWSWDKLGYCAAVIVGLTGLLTTLSLRAIANYDR